MKCQNLFSGKNAKNISISHLLNILTRVLSVKEKYTVIRLSIGTDRPEKKV